MRTDQPRQQGMDHWKGPHSKIISTAPGMEEYRQIHLAGDQSRAVASRQRRRDGHSGRTQDRRGRRGHVHVRFLPAAGPQADQARVQGRGERLRRTLLYAGRPYSARWYDVAGPAEKVGARSLIYPAGGTASRPVRSGRSSRMSLSPLSSRQGRCGNSEPRSSCPGSNDSGTRRTWRTTTPRTSGSTPH